MQRRDGLEEERYYREQERFYFKERTTWLRKHYQTLALLKAEIRQLEEEKKRIYENYPKFDWTQVKVNNGSKSDPTFQAVTRLRELEERHLWTTHTLRVLEWARDQLKPEDKQLFDGFILEGKSLSEISRRTGLSWDKTKRRLVHICEKMENRLSLFLKEGCD